MLLGDHTRQTGSDAIGTIWPTDQVRYREENTINSSINISSGLQDGFVGWNIISTKRLLGRSRFHQGNAMGMDKPDVSRTVWRVDSYIFTQGNSSYIDLSYIPWPLIRHRTYDWGTQTSKSYYGSYPQPGGFRGNSLKNITGRIRNICLSQQDDDDDDYSDHWCFMITFVHKGG